MLNFISGLVILLISAIMLVSAFHPRILKSDGKYFNSLLLIVLAGLALRLFVGADGFLHEWDEKYHALVAKNLIEDPLKPALYKNAPLPYDHKNWVGNHIWLEKGPVPLWSMALSMRIFGEHVYALRIPSLDLSLVGIILTFLLGYLMFNVRTGLIAASFHSMHGLLIELGGGRVSSDHVETFFVFFVQLAIFFAVYHAKHKAKLWPVFLVGVSTALAILSKWFPALIVFPVWLIAWMVFQPGKWRSGLLYVGLGMLITTVIIAPYFIYIFQLFPAEASHIMTKFMGAYGSTLEEHQGPWYFYIHKAGMLFGEIIYIPLGMAVYNLFTLKCKKPVIILLSWILIPMLVFSLAETKRITYLMISAPAFFIFTAYYVRYFLELYKSKKPGWLYGLILILLIILPARYSIERTKPFQNLNRNPAWVTQLKNIDTGKSNGKIVFFNIEKYIDLMFYHNCIAYRHIPSNEEIDLLSSEGYKIIVHDSGNLPPGFSHSEKITIRKLY
jgi:4-amino-4-deoxy-L-arabinose transferase